MRVKLAALTLAIALLMLLPSRAKADTFIYNVTSTFNAVDVTFDLPTFQEFVTTTTFTTNTSSLGPFKEFTLSGNSTHCIESGGILGGPCFSGFTATTPGGFGTFGPSFSGPGKFTGGGL